jgi:quercetin dioxygenase-like cupin family protein
MGGRFLRWSTVPSVEVKPGVHVLEARGRAIEVGKIRLAAGTKMAEHVHPEEQIFYVLRGRLRYRIGDVEDVAGPGDLIVMPGGVPHAGCVEGDGEAEFVEIKEIRAT